MKLEDYVKQSLLDITNGVKKAIQDSDVPIAPSQIDGKKIQPTPQLISFEIAVTVSKTGGAGIDVLPFELKGKASSEHVNKISFQVPVYFTLNWTHKL